MPILVVVLILVCALVALRYKGTREVRLVRIARVAAPLETTLDLVSQVEYMPEWHVRSGLLPRPLRPATLSSWGESIQPRDRLRWSTTDTHEPLQLRSIPGREFGYRRCSRGAVRYESVFRVSAGPGAGDTQLRWEVHYQLLRTIDALNPWSVRNAVWRGMDESLELIRSLAEAVADAAKPAWQKTHQMAS